MKPIVAALPIVFAAAAAEGSVSAKEDILGAIQDARVEAKRVEKEDKPKPGRYLRLRDLEPEGRGRGRGGRGRGRGPGRGAIAAVLGPENEAKKVVEEVETLPHQARRYLRTRDLGPEGRGRGHGRGGGRGRGRGRGGR